MKKLLSLLSTIAGSGMTGIVANSLIPLKEENNNLQNLYRIKRGIKQHENILNDYIIDLSFEINKLALAIKENVGGYFNYLEINDTVKPLFIQSRTNGVISTTFLFLILLIVFVIIIFFS